MIADAATPILLTQAHLVTELPAHEAEVIRLDEDWGHIAQESVAKPETSVQPDNLAYVIYTSGSTGRPKGAMLHHRGLSNLTAVQQQAFDIEPGTRVLQFSPFSFDASVWETFMALANGGTLCLARQEVLASGPALLDLLKQERVHIVTLPPSMLSVLPPASLPDLRTVISAGEACTAELVAQWAPGRTFFNAYGPTETTVCASMYRCEEHETADPPIGRPIGNSRLYIVDANDQPLPVGVPGELCIGGVNVGHGYLNRPELTAEKFIRDPFVSDASTPLYKTGDLVRYRPDGNIEFLGRIDHQVKVRGFRIELGEIEATLRQHEDVQDAVVLARDDTPGGRQLVAYVTAADSVAPEIDDLRGFLRGVLPEYMIPAFFITLDTFPLTPSGKVDRRDLPSVDGQQLSGAREYVAPRNETEQQLAEISATLLGVDQVGVHDNFFQLGGHSLLATQFVSRIRETMQVDVPLRELFEQPTIAGLAERIEELKSETGPKISEIAALMGKVQDLSEDEVKALLQEKASTRITETQSQKGE
jgi:amino acid adenylation domain-containing protein